MCLLLITRAHDHHNTMCLQATVSFQLDQDSFSLTDDSGERIVYRGQRNIIFSRGNGADVTISVTL